MSEKQITSVIHNVYESMLSDCGSPRETCGSETKLNRNLLQQLWATEEDRVDIVEVIGQVCIYL